MWKTPKSFNKINVQILTVLILLLIVAGLIVSAFNYANIHAVYEKSYTEKILMSNGMVTSSVHSEDVLYYVDLMVKQDDAFREKQIRFNEDRIALFELQKNGASEEEQSAIMNRMKAFCEEASALKNPDYYDVVDQLRTLKETSGAKYVHMFADTGIRDDEGRTMYTCIFDAEDIGFFDKADSDTLGTTAYYEQTADDMYVTKQAMSRAVYYDDEIYGEMYYAYTPVLDDGGNVIAVVSTEIGVEEMQGRINETMIVNTTIFAVFILIAIMFIYFFINQFVARPLDLLTGTATKLANGNVNVYVPDQTLKINNELGILANAIKGMADTFQSLVNSTFAIFDAANSGKLDVRNDLDSYSGDIAIVAKQINDTLDVMTLFLNSVPESICIVTKQLRMLFSNSKYEELFGDMSADMFAREILPDSSGLTRAELRKLFKAALERGETIGYWKNDMCFSVMLTDVAEDSVMIVAIDITDLMKEKENAQAAAKAKSDFLSRMSHEMRTPMNAIIGMVKIAESTTNIEKLSHCLTTINASSNHLLGIINDVLDMSKIDAGQLTLEHEQLSLEKILMKVCNLVADQVERRHQKLSVIINSDLAMNYLGDELRLSQVLANLLSNAVKFTPDEGRIEVAVKEVRTEGSFSTLYFTVTDTGIGITDEQKSRLFNSFEQADGSITRRFGGTGLGLAISKSIVEKMDGKIGVDSEFNKGSTFYFEVKLEKSSEQDERKFDEAIREKTRIMIIDEDENDRGQLKDIVAGFGLNVSVTGSREDAMAHARSALMTNERYDVVLASLSAPGIASGGVDEVTKLSSIIDINSIVIMTSFLEWNRIEGVVNQVGVTRFLAKPLFKSTVYNMISSILVRNEVDPAFSTTIDQTVPDLSHLKVLLAEDVEINREIFKALMEETKIEIVEAVNGVIAVDEFKKNMHEYDLIFMDVQMPEMDGHEATRTIRSLDDEWAKNIPILAMTANVFKEDIDQCIDAGMNDHLSKPIDEKIIFEKIKQYVQPKSGRI